MEAKEKNIFVTRASLPPYEEYEELIKDICKDNPGADKRMLRAILDGNIKGWPEAIKNPRYVSKHSAERN